MRTRPALIALLALGACTSGPKADWSDGTAVAVAVLQTVAPAALGAALGRRIPAVPTRLGLAAALVGVPCLLDLGLAVLGLWDLLWMLLALAVGLLAPRAAGRLGAGLLLTLALAEGGARLLFGDAPRYPPITHGPLHRLSDQDENAVGSTWAWETKACHAAYAETRAGTAFRDARVGDLGDGPVVLHLGDSLTWGLGVPQDQTFVGLLDAAGPARHLNAGLPGTSTDVALLVARGWVGPLGVDRVVLHVFVGNDVTEIDFPYACCPGGPLLDRTDPSLPRRCPRSALPEGEGGFGYRTLQLSEAPLPLAALSRTTVLVGRLRAHLGFLARRGLPRSGGLLEGEVHVVATVGALQRELEDQGVPLVVVVHPSVLEIGHDDPDRAAASLSRSLGTLCRERSIPLYDASEAVFAGTDDPSPRYLSDQIHYSAEGHRRLAAWLQTLLEDGPEPP